MISYSCMYMRSVEPSICNMDIIVPLEPIYNPINSTRLEKFINNVKQGIPDSVRILRYDIEGQPVIDSLFFDGKIITSIEDTTKASGLSKGAIYKFEGNGISKEETNRIINYNLTMNGKHVVRIFGYLRPHLPYNRCCY